jgi:hypothetical protein
MYQNTTPVRSLEYRRRLLAGEVAAGTSSSDPEATAVKKEKTSEEQSRSEDNV